MNKTQVRPLQTVPGGNGVDTHSGGFSFAGTVPTGVTVGNGRNGSPADQNGVLNVTGVSGHVAGANAVGVNAAGVNTAEGIGFVPTAGAAPDQRRQGTASYEQALDDKLGALADAITTMADKVKTVAGLQRTEKRTKEAGDGLFDLVPGRRALLHGNAEEITDEQFEIIAKKQRIDQDCKVLKKPAGIGFGTEFNKLLYQRCENEKQEVDLVQKKLKVHGDRAKLELDATIRQVRGLHFVCLCFLHQMDQIVKSTSKFLRQQYLCS